jgi:hypothetical protein
MMVLAFRGPGGAFRSARCVLPSKYRQLTRRRGEMTDTTLLCEVMERRGYTHQQAQEAAAKFIRIEDVRRPVYPRTLPFIWRNRTHYITADRDNAGRLILKRSASV